MTEGPLDRAPAVSLLGGAAMDTPPFALVAPQVVVARPGGFEYVVPTDPQSLLDCEACQ